MQLSPQFEKERNGTDSSLSPAIVREQLRRLLAHPLFTNSKRYPVLLAYTVEQTLTGNSAELKERTIGVEAFGRAPNYDVNVDPVVRMTAAEVRKRLSQYYINPAHAGELVIELPVGSYVPSFREASAPAEAIAPDPKASSTVELPQPAVAITSNSVPASASPSGRHWIITAASVVAALALGFGLGRLRIPKPPTNLERFWAPITSSSNRVTYCLGEPVDAIDRQRRTPEDQPTGNLNASDVVSLARSIVPLVPQNRAFRVVSASDAGFAQLREGPVVLIGAFDNSWTLRITQDLPFGFSYDNDVRQVVDRKSSPKRSWTFQWQVPNTKLAKDYAIVARLHDNITGQPVILLAGILGEGTEAAGEVVSNPVYLNALLAKVPANWDQLNLEAVIETDVVDGHPGPPTIVAVQTW